MSWNDVFAGSKSSDEMVFTGLDFMFGGITTMAVWRYTLVIDVVFAKIGFKFVRELIF